MNIVKYKHKNICRIDFSCLYQTKEYENAVNYANQNISIPGVREILEKIQNDYKEYEEQLVCLKNEEMQNENRKYVLWEKVHKGKVIGMWVAIISIIISMCLNPGTSYILLGIQLLTILFSFIGIASVVILKIAEMISRKLYQSYAEKLGRKVGDINARYAHMFDMLWNEIDGLYLASLDPEHRELVRMRRDNERYHQENIHLQQAFEKVQNDILKEQEKTRELQAQLLAIEQAREERCNKW